MYFNLTADQKLFRDSTGNYLEREAPLAEVRRLGDLEVGYDSTWWRRGAELGWLSTLVPESLGGGSVSDSGLRDLSVLAHEMGRRVAPGPLAIANAAIQTLASATRPDGELLAALVSGEQTVTWAVAEGAGAFDPLRPTVRAQEVRDGWTLDGSKVLVESADQADMFLVTADGPDGPIQLLVPSGADGVGITPVRSLDIVRRYATVAFDHCTVPGSARVESPAGAVADIVRQWQTVSALQSVETVGVVDRVLEFTVQWAFDRYTFGRPLASYQALKHRFADMYTWHQAAAAAAGEAIAAVADGKPDAGDAVSTAAAFVGQRATDIIQDCVHMHGGIGVTWEHDIHLYLRRATVNRMAYGTPHDHLLRLAAAVAAA